MTHTTVYPGTFDPITNGHVNIITRAARLFDHVIVACAENTGKTPFFSLEQRVSMAAKTFKTLDNVTVMSFSGLLVDFVYEQDAQSILRGVRVASDFDYEFQLAGMNRQLANTVESIFLPASEKWTYLSSTLIRDVITLGGDPEPFVPNSVMLQLEEMDA